MRHEELTAHEIEVLARLLEKETKENPNGREIETVKAIYRLMSKARRVRALLWE
jgi:hypothetical protein